MTHLDSTYRPSNAAQHLSRIINGKKHELGLLEAEYKRIREEYAGIQSLSVRISKLKSDIKTAERSIELLDESV